MRRGLQGRRLKTCRLSHRQWWETKILERIYQRDPYYSRWHGGDGGDKGHWPKGHNPAHWYHDLSDPDTLRDHEEAIAECELCGKKGLRYHFKIIYVGPKPEENLPYLWIGSDCILRHDVPMRREGSVVEQGQREEAIKSSKSSRYKIQHLRQLRGMSLDLDNAPASQYASRMITRLEDLYQIYDAQGAYSPLQAVEVLTCAKTLGSALNPSAVRISLRKQESREEILRLTDEEINLLKPALKAAQMIKIMEMIKKCKKSENTP